MNRLDARVDAARRAMTAAGKLPRGLVPNRERIDTDHFSGEIYFNNDRQKPEWVAKVVFRTAEDSGRIEMVRAASKDELMAELLRQVGDLETQTQDLSAPTKSKTQVRLADYESPEAMFEDVLCSANPQYARNKPNAWVNGFTIIEVLPSGNFNVFPCVVTKGKFSFGGRIYGQK